jgi:hypothetical protein
MSGGVSSQSVQSAALTLAAICDSGEITDTSGPALVALRRELELAGSLNVADREATLQRVQSRLAALI